jgi:hypothetical protein
VYKYSVAEHCKGECGGLIQDEPQLNCKNVSENNRCVGFIQTVYLPNLEVRRYIPCEFREPVVNNIAICRI